MADTAPAPTPAERYATFRERRELAAYLPQPAIREAGADALLERARGIAHRLVLEALVPAAVGRAVVVVVGPLGQLIEVGHQERVGHAAARAAPSSAGC